MDLHCEMMLDEFVEKKNVFQKIQSLVQEQLHKFAEISGIEVDIIASRIKTEKSLKGKLELKGHKYRTLSDITDLVGARVVLFYNDQVDKFAALVEQYFDIDWENSIDKRKIYKVDQFGYMSLHYICRIPKDMFYDESLPDVNEFRFEIQLRTSLQHVWASIYHDTGYKTDVEVPREYLRRLTRLAGILEMVDDEFNNIRISLDDYRRKMRTFIKDGNFGEVELNGDSYREFLEIKPFLKLNKRISEINNMEIQDISLLPFLDVFKTIGLSTLDDLHKVITNYGEDAYQLAVRQFAGTDLDIMSSFTGPQLLVCAYILKNGGSEANLVTALNALYGQRTSNARYAKRITLIAKNMGMID